MDILFNVYPLVGMGKHTPPKIPTLEACPTIKKVFNRKTDAKNEFYVSQLMEIDIHSILVELSSNKNEIFPHLRCQKKRRSPKLAKNRTENIFYKNEF